MTTSTAEPMRLTTSVPSSEGPWRRAGHQFLRQRSALIGLVVIGLLAFTALFAPLLAPNDPIGVLL
ncbi:MAG: ABC transporter permease, partial [Chloroflexales bacterium]